MLIRAEQMQVFETAAEENFAQRIAAHLKENYSTAIVRLPDAESAIQDLPDEKLHALVRIGIERARSYGLTFESSIAAYTATMFAVSPNFDRHRLSQVLLTDENYEPDARIGELLEVLTDKNWETIRADYDVNDWQPRAEKSEKSETAEEAEKTEKPAEPEMSDFAKTVMNVAPPERTKPPVAIDDISFDATLVNYESAKKNNSDAATAPNLDLPDTILNINFDKE